MKIIINPKYHESEEGRFDYFKRVIISQLKANQTYKILDVGCSQLDLSEFSSQVEVFGIDYIPSGIYDDNHFSLCNLNTDKIPFGDNAFDFVIAGEVIEHIKRPFEFIEEVHRVLKPSGRLLLSTPNPHYYMEILKDILGIFKIDDFEHLNLFSKIHLVSYCEKTGLRLLTFKRYKFWIPFIKLMILSMNTPRLFNYQNVYIFEKMKQTF